MIGRECSVEVGNGVERTLGKILGTQEQILKELEKHNGRLEKHIEEDNILQKKVNKIENKLAYMSGVGVAAIAVFTFGSELVMKAIGFR